MTDKQLEEIITRKCGAYRNYSSMTHMQAKYCMKQAIEADRAEIKDKIKETITTLKHAKVFISSCEKMNPTGITLYNENIKSLEKFFNPTED
jgi:hypothetical protein